MCCWGWSARHKVGERLAGVAFLLIPRHDGMSNRICQDGDVGAATADSVGWPGLRDDMCGWHLLIVGRRRWLVGHCGVSGAAGRGCRG